ncbi:spermatogenesis-associated protein 22-like [Cololabis saira]|uniref:spermatogenesis-associated protein 22-like n=1 Tax=Cololabis saira TaxID=129043 RepID=UPI002AD1EAFB|nr:spermatogenesis-associated protein 22-like [Cololabis saira]
MQRKQQEPHRAAAGQLPVLLFNQRKRNRVPLTSAPCENNFFSHSEYIQSPSSAAPHNSSGVYGGHPATGQSSGTPQSHQWSVPQAAPRQQYGSNKSAPGPFPAKKSYTCMPHPYKAGATSSMVGQSGNPVRQQLQFSSKANSKQSQYQGVHGGESPKSVPAPHTGFSQMSQQSSRKPPIPVNQYSQQSRPVPPTQTTPERSSAYTFKSPNNSWKFTNSFEGENSSFVKKKSSNQSQTAQPPKTQRETLPEKPVVENSLRILTATIDGMRHWSQFKDKVSYLFEIFATLDSAVTLGRFGAKNFLMSNGKEVVQCVFYENEQALPRLIRGQIHRCVGNYDRDRDVLICVSVRPGLPSELRNAQQAVKACDAEMRALVKTLSEV